MRYSMIRSAGGTLIVGVLVTSMLAGCGLKGPLYRPGENRSQDAKSGTNTSGGKPPMVDRVPAPQAQKNEDGTSTETPATVDPDRPATPPRTP